MEVYLIRHTTPAIAKGICYGQSDLDVAATFETEAQQVAQGLSRYQLPKNTPCYSSPLKRCHKLAKHLDFQTIKTDPRLMEMDFGDWEMQPWDSIERAVLDQWGADFVNQSVPNGESYLQLYSRCLAFIEALKKTQEGKACIVTHAGFIRAFLTFCNQGNLKDSFDIKAPYGTILTCQV